MTTRENSSNLLLNGLYGEPEYGPGLLGANVFVKGSEIYEDARNKRINFPVAGYTQAVTSYGPYKSEPLQHMFGQWRNISRQTVIYEVARAGNASAIGAIQNQSGVQIIATGRTLLIPDPTNPYDKNAILIVQDIGSVWYPVGYVPARINKMLLDKADWYQDNMSTMALAVNSARHYIARIDIGYKVPINQHSRFMNIQYD